MFLPGAMANMAPPLFKRINFLNYNLDFGKKINGKRIFGNNKTFRGLFFGIIFAVIISIVIKYFFIKDFNLIMGALSGLFALLGDALESMFKRQLSIKPGLPFIPFDQIDWVIGSSFVLYLYNYLDLYEILIAIILFFFLHIIVKHIGYYLRIDNNRW